MNHAQARIDESCCLLVVDAQNGFMPGGGLPVADGDAIVPVINRIAPLFANAVITQDWHPADHVSFAANHAGRQPFDTIMLPYGEQVLWPVHCVQGTQDAELHPDLQLTQAQLIISMKNRLAEITAAQTGKSVEQINADGDRDRWFTADEALEYGFVDHIRESAADVVGGGGTDAN